MVRSCQKSMLVFMIPSFDLNAARSRPENVIKMFISLIVDVVDPPKQRSKHPVMSPTLEKALSEIEKGAEERLEVLQNKKKQVEEGEASVETVPKLIGHIEKVKEEELEEQTEGDKPAAEKEVGGGLTADKEAAAAEETGGEQTTSKDTEQIDEMAKPMDKDETAKPTDKDETAKPMDKDEKAEASGSARRKPRMHPFHHQTER